jgi:hypothetical protein
MNAIPGVDLNTMMKAVEAVAQSPPGPSVAPTQPANTVESPPVNRSADFDRQFVIMEDLLRTFSGLATAGPNSTQSGILQQNVGELQAQRDALVSEIETLETAAATDSSPFIEEAPAVTGISREKIFTLQDYILFILVAAYGFAALALFFLIGKRTGWDKNALIKTLVVGVIISVLLYILVKNFA